MKTYDQMIRVSQMNGRSETNESTHTIDEQKRANAAAAKVLGGRIGKTFQFLDQSGFTVLGKHGDEIVERVRAGKSAGIIAPYSSRLGRNWWEGGAFFEAMNAVDGEVIDATQPKVDYRSDEGRTLWGLKMVTNELPSLEAKKRSRGLADALVAKGIPNRVPFGYRRNADLLGVKVEPQREAKSLVPEPTQAPIVQRIFELRSEGHGSFSICTILNDAGAPAPRGGRWTKGTLDALVKNDSYLGVVKLGKRRNEKAHEPLVSRALFLRAQSTRPIIRNGRLVGGVAGKLLICSGCGQPMSVNGSGDGRTSYGCRRDSTKSVCPRPVYVSKPAADEFVIDILDELFTGGELEVTAGTVDLGALRHGVEVAKDELEAFVDAASALDRAVFKRGLDKRQAAVDAAQFALDEADLGNAEDAELPTAEEWAQMVASDDVAGMRRVAETLLAEIIVSPPRSRSKFEPIADRFEEVWRSRG